MAVIVFLEGGGGSQSSQPKAGNGESIASHSNRPILPKQWGMRPAFLSYIPCLRLIITSAVGSSVVTLSLIGFLLPLRVHGAISGPSIQALSSSGHPNMSAPFLTCEMCLINGNPKRLF